MRIRSHLLLLAAVVLVPGFLAAALAIAAVREGERQAALTGLDETVRATALLVDGQVLREVGALTALGQSAHLQSGDFEAFDIGTRPSRWLPWDAAARAEVLAHATPLLALAARHATRKADLDAAVAKIGLPAAALVYIPMITFREDGVALLDAEKATWWGMRW